MIEQAEATIEAGEYEAASRALMQVVQIEPHNGRAIAGLVNCLIGLEDLEGAAQVLEQAPEEAKGAELDRARAALELAEQAADTGDLAPLKEAVEKNPSDHQARFDLAIALNAAGAREEAVEELLTIFAADKEWNDQAARKQLLTFFEAYGPTDEVTLNGRRRLSSLLFS